MPASAEPRTSSGARAGAGRPEDDRAISTTTTVAATRWRNSTIRDLADQREQPAAAQRPAVGAAAGGAAAEPGIAHADNPSDQDQGEGGDDGRGEEATKAARIAAKATPCITVRLPGRSVAAWPRPCRPPGGSGSGAAAAGAGPARGAKPAAVADRLADVVQRLGAADVGDGVEVVRGRGREREPLERRAAPRVVAERDPLCQLRRRCRARAGPRSRARRRRSSRSG